ncbi:MAG: phosphodiester glycosidase family protein [Bacteroidota bacterium]
MPKLFLRLLAACFVLVLIFSEKIQSKNALPIAIEWKYLDNGLSVTEINGPYISKYSDSKVTVLKIDPNFFDIEMIVATETDSILRTIKEWCKIKELTGAVNAGMYSLKDHISSLGFMQNNSHVTNPNIKNNFNALAVFNPKDPTLSSFQIIDMVNQDWKPILQNYSSCFQSIRMIDDSGKAIYWSHKPILSCSMSVLAKDKSGNILFLFTRSPYNANEFIDFMLTSGLNIQTAMYLEGGPEASLYVQTDANEITKFGSYVSFSNPDDDNLELRKMPNILGFRKKIKK